MTTVSLFFLHTFFGNFLLLSVIREYVSSKTINKVIQVHDRIFCCMAGSLADAQAVTKTAKFQLSFHRGQKSGGTSRSRLIGW
uniref:Uncharacterized protein n=1 Tax=Oryzias sinensis TaxID=183150 RepID=A0A8C7WWG4_9TELE